MRILAVVPAYNEASALAAVVSDLRQSAAALGLDLQVAVVDDGSTDHTSAVAFSCGARVVRLCRNLGIGGAVQSGLRLALREGFHYAVQVDGDGQHPADQLAKLLERLRDVPQPDMVVGTRFSGDEGFRSTVLRRLGAWWIRCLLRLVCRLKVSDPTSGYRVYGPRALRLFDRTYPYDYPEPESLAVAQAVGLRIVEQPVVMRERKHGRSSIRGLAAPYYMLKVSLAIILSYLRSRGTAIPGEHENGSI